MDLFTLIKEHADCFSIECSCIIMFRFVHRHGPERGIAVALMFPHSSILRKDTGIVLGGGGAGGEITLSPSINHYSRRVCGNVSERAIAGKWLAHICACAQTIRMSIIKASLWNDEAERFF